MLLSLIELTSTVVEKKEVKSFYGLQKCVSTRISKVTQFSIVVSLNTL